MGYFRGPKFPVFTSKSSKRGNGSFRENLKESLLDDDRVEAAVPRGFLAVYVGPELKRFVIPTSYLCLPIFESLMDKVAEEFGFEQTGGLRIPCDEDHFKEILDMLKESDAEKKTAAKNKKKSLGIL